MNIQEGSIIPTSKMQISLSRVQILFIVYLGVVRVLNWKSKTVFKNQKQIVHFVMNQIIQDDIILMSPNRFYWIYNRPVTFNL